MLTTVVAVGLGGYLAVVAALFAFQERLLFFPEPLPPSHRFALDGVVERSVAVEGARLSALHLRQPGAPGLVFFLHGNAGNLATWLPDTGFWKRSGWDLFMLDYRGYGKSEGRISSEAQLHADVMAAWRAVAGEYAGRRIVIYGRSLGTGLAARLATEVDADHLVLVSPYRSVRALAAELYPWAPTAILRYPLPTEAWLPQVRMPVTLVHGERDEVIPIAHAQALAALRADATTVWLPDAGHNDVQLSGRYLEALAGLLAGVAAGAPGRPAAR